MNYQPPKLVERLFSIFCSDAFVEDLFGDLYEWYQLRRSKRNSNAIMVNLHYWYQAFRLLSSYAIKKRKKASSTATYYNSQKLNVMLLNYVRISLRNILKNKTFTLLNVFGLGLGMCIGLLALSVYTELHRFEEIHPDSEYIYRITSIIEENGNKEYYASTPTPLAYSIDDQLSEIENSVHINDRYFPQVINAGEPIQLHGYITEPSFLEMFAFPLAKGSREVLNRPDMVILTHEAAEKLFGDKEAMGQNLETEDHGSLLVGGVLAPFPKGTHFDFDLLVGFKNAQNLKTNNASNWTEFGSNYYYFKTKSDPGEIEGKLNSLSSIGQFFYEQEDLKASFEVQSIGDINPGKKFRDTIGLAFDRAGMYAFFGTTLLILIPACFNYANMAIANALKRSKEIGIRKIMGSGNRQIVHQFLVETVIICLLGLFIAVPFFNYARTELMSMLVGGTALSMELTPGLAIIFFLFALGTGLFTGLIPAIYFSKITPIKALRNSSNNERVSVSGLKKGLLVFQFVLSLAFMIGIGVLLKQYRVSLNFDKGFAKENVLVIPIAPGTKQLVENTLSTSASVVDMSFSSTVPGTSLGRTTYLYSEDNLDSLRARVFYSDNQYIDHMGIDMVWGDGQLMDTQIEQVLVNETLMDRLANLRSFEKDSLLAQLAGNKKVQVVGVFKDYNHEPLNERIEPMLIRKNEERLTFALLTLKTEDVVSTLNTLESRWDEVFPNTPFKASFLENEIEKAYTFYIVGLKLFGLLAALAITISCLGLLGMVIYTTENRKKEVAIRKTLGASQFRLLYSLSGLFFRMWAIALVIGIPLSYLYYDKLMLQIYNKFSGGVGFSEVALSSLFTLSLGLMAILIQSTKIIQTNPADILRND